MNEETKARIDGVLDKFTEKLEVLSKLKSCPHMTPDGEQVSIICQRLASALASANNLVDIMSVILEDMPSYHNVAEERCVVMLRVVKNLCHYLEEEVDHTIYVMAG